MRRNRGMRKKSGRPPPDGTGGGGVPPPKPTKENKEKGKGKGKNAKGEPLCFSWGRGRDGPCKDLPPGSGCKNTPQRKPECEFCGAADHKSKACSKKPDWAKAW